jgi:uncharacterized protein YuzE
MSKKINFKVKVAKPCVPIVEVDTMAQALYVYFQRGVKIARTVVQNQWPLVTVDLDKDGGVIGVEACGVDEFTLSPVLNKARVEAPARLVNSARYVPTPAPAGVGR